MIISDKLTGHDIIRPVVAFGSMKGEAKRNGGSVKAVRTKGRGSKIHKILHSPFNMAPCPCLRCHSVRTMPKKYYLNPKSALKICASFTCQSKLWRQRNRIDLRRTRTSKSDFVLWGFHFKYVPNFVMIRWACLCSDKLSRTQISRENIPESWVIWRKPHLPRRLFLRCRVSSFISRMYLEIGQLGEGLPSKSFVVVV